MGRGKHGVSRIAGFTLEGYAGLGVAIFARAVRDVNSGNGQRADALDFLGGPWAAELLEALAGALAIDLTTEDLGALCHRLKAA